MLRTVGQALWIFGMLALVSGCYDPDDYVLNKGLSPSNVIELTVSSTWLPADGASLATLKAKIPPNADSDKRMVTFETSIGTLHNGAKTIDIKTDASGVASAWLTSSITESVGAVRASISGVVREVDIRFERAYPDTIVLDPGTFALRASSAENTTVTADLRRTTGKASVGTEVQFAATDSTGSRIGQFRDVRLSNQSGTATALFTVGDTGYRGAVTITAAVDVGGGAVVGSSNIAVIDP